MELYRPVLTNRLTQGFGESLACAKTDIHGRITYPISIKSKINSVCGVGYKDFYNLMGLKAHNGLDLLTWHGEPIYHCANFDGVMRTETDSAGGIGVDVISKQPVLTDRYVKIRYWHLKNVIGWDGKEIKQGDLIGQADNTGASGGDHLHWAPKWCDENGNNTIEPDNGYYGAFDPTPYYHNIFVRDILGLSPERLTLAQNTSKLIFQAQMLLKDILKRH